MGKRFYALLSTLTVFLLVSAPSFAYEGATDSIPDNAETWAHLWKEVLIDITLVGSLFAAITVYLLVKYRRTSPDQEGTPVKMSSMASAGWVVIPVFLFLADDFYLAANAWKLWNNFRRVPANSYEVQLESRMWMWNYKYPEGHTTVNELRVPAGRPVVLRMKSADVLHSHYMPDFKVKEDSMPGRVTYLWFHPKKPGEHVVTCAEYCGIMHSGMKGKVIVMPEDEFAAWIEEKSGKPYIRKGGA